MADKSWKARASNWLHGALFPVRMWLQRRRRGFDDRELWDLDVTIAAYLHPRLVAFKAGTCTVAGGMSDDEWLEALDDMCFAFDHISKRWERDPFNEETEERIERGLMLFGTYFESLWD